MILEETLQAIARDAENRYPLECCGIVTPDGKVVPAENIAENKVQRFMISGNWLRHQTVAAIYHSHVDRPAYPSREDFNGLAFPEKPYIIAAVRHGVCIDIQIFRVVDRNENTWFERINGWQRK
jgi:proteasome lid subunit RPN8/RPN11